MDDLDTLHDSGLNGPQVVSIQGLSQVNCQIIPSFYGITSWVGSLSLLKLSEKTAKKVRQDLGSKA